MVHRLNICFFLTGSSRFKEPIDSLKQRTTELDEFRSEKLNRVKLVEKEKDELEKPMKEALEYLNAENEITQKKNLLYQKYITTFQGKIEETNKKKAEFEANCQVCNFTKFLILSEVKKIIHYYLIF